MMVSARQRLVPTIGRLEGPEGNAKDEFARSLRVLRCRLSHSHASSARRLLCFPRNKMPPRPHIGVWRQDLPSGSNPPLKAFPSKLAYRCPGRHLGRSFGNVLSDHQVLKPLDVTTELPGNRR